MAASAPTKARAGKGDTLTARQARLALVLLTPTFLLLLIVAFYPLARTFTSSFTDEPFAKPEAPITQVGMANYQRLLGVVVLPIPEGSRVNDVLPRVEKTETYPAYRYRRITTFTGPGGQEYVFGASDPDFIQSIGNTIVYTVISVAAELVIGLGIALVVNSRFRGRGIMRAVMLIPWAIPTAISTTLWRQMLTDNTSGPINAVLVGLGLIENGIAWRSNYPLFSVVFVDVWKTAPFMALLLLAGLQTISTDLYEAGAVDGATGLQRFLKITFPLLMPTIIVALIFRTLDALRAFDVFQIFLGRSTPSMAVYNYESLVTGAYGYASAVGVVIFIIIFAFTILYMSAFRVDED
jgi:trehalose/maltose transport system permease protein